MSLTADAYATAFTTDLLIADASRDRSLQTDPGISSLGVCKRQWQMLTTGAPRTDAPFRMSAFVGTAIHAALGEVRHTLNPHLILEREVHLTLPNGLRVRGHLDECDPTEPSVTDYKTNDGLALARRDGADAQKRFQRHGYYAAALQDGLIDDDQGVARNVHLDRSGKDDTVHVEQEQFDPNLIDLAARWVDEVQADTDAGREADREKWPAWCASYCPFFTACRVGPVADVDNPWVARAARMVLDGRAAAKENKELVDALREEMRGVSGRTPDGLLIAWTSDGKLTVKADRAPAVVSA